MTKNNETTIKETLESVKGLAFQILVADLGSTDETIKICKRHGAKVVTFCLEGDYAKIRNTLLAESQTEWNLLIHPWEVLANGHEELKKELNGNSYQIPVFQGNVLSKEIRLWRNIEFKNPVFETLYDEKSQLFKHALIYAKQSTDHFEKWSILERWRKTSPASSQPIYYQAHLYLAEGRYKEFVVAAERYLFKEKIGVSAIMLKYYLSLINSYHFKNIELARYHLLPCILANPLMAEFWCLLGDIDYQKNRYNHAIAWYENAMFLGSKRLTSDEFPMEVDKYKKYPQKMIENCNEMQKNSITLGCLVDSRQR